MSTFEERKKYQWYVEKWEGEMYIHEAIRPMSLSEAEGLKEILSITPGNEKFTFKVVNALDRHTPTQDNEVNNVL